MNKTKNDKLREQLVLEISKMQSMPLEVIQKLVDAKGKLRKTSFAKRLHEKTSW